jgi:hypothetical protein
MRARASGTEPRVSEGRSDSLIVPFKTALFTSTHPFAHRPREATREAWRGFCDLDWELSTT